jgi:hypothetical protein
LELEGLFYAERYEEAWKRLLQLKGNNENFSQYLEELSKAPSSNNSLLKFIRIYTVFAKMDHLFFKDGNQQVNFDDIIRAVNANTPFHVEETAIRKLYTVCAEAKRLQELELFFKRFKEGPQVSIEDSFEQFDSCLTPFNIQTMRSVKNNKEVTVVKISQDFSSSFKELREELEKYYLRNNPGVSRVNDIK